MYKYMHIITYVHIYYTIRVLCRLGEIKQTTGNEEEASLNIDLSKVAFSDVDNE